MLGEEITLDTFADVFEKMDVRSRADLGYLVIYSGTHPDHGECVLLQHWTEGAYLWAEAIRVARRYH